MANQVRIGVGVVLKGEKDLDKLRDKFERLQKMGAKGFGVGVGAAITTAGINLVGNAIGGLGNVLGDVVKAGMAEEESIARLGASLKANVPGWDGNTAAIEKNMAAGIKLGFTDEEQRASLAFLVAATHDVTKALEIQFTAMDLARFKGISLGEATSALVSIDAGRARGLAALGINVKDYSTIEERLTAVQKLAAGQAEDYANTTEGKLVVAQTKLTEVMDRLGVQTLPLVTAALDEASGALDGVASVLDVLSGKLPATEAGFKGATMSALDMVIALNFLNPGVSNIAQKMKADLAKGFDAASAAASDGIDNFDRMNTSLVGIGFTAPKTAAAVVDSYGKIAGGSRPVIQSLTDISDAYDATWAKLTGAASTAADDIFGPLERRAKLTTTKLAQIKDLGIINDPKSSKSDVASARADLISLNKDYFTLMAEMAGRGELTAAELKKIKAGLKDELKTASAEEETSIRALLALLGQLKTASAGVFHAGPAGIGAKARAGGGPVSAGQAYVVGEQHAELFVPNQSGTIIPSIGGSSSGGSDASAQWLPVIAAQLSRLTAQEPAAARPMTARGDLARQSALMPGGRL